jgi:hypothetical protein
MRPIGVSEAARRLGLSYSRLIQMTREGKVACTRDSVGRRQFDPAVIDALAAARAARRGPAEPQTSVESPAPAA